MMTDNGVHMWKPRGHIYFWRYPDAYRDYPGWHLSADLEGAASLLELIAAFQASPVACCRTLHLSPPTQSVLRVPNNGNGKAHAWSPRRLRITFDPGDAATGNWNLVLDQDAAVLSLGERYLALFKTGVLDIEHGRGDYCIGGHKREAPRERTCMWFWWQAGPE